MKTSTYLKLLLIMPLIVLASCKKGDVGPQGETGAAGAQGEQGDKGDKGATGTANVIYSDWVYATNFRDTIADNSQVKAGDVAAPKLTTALLNNASIQVYFTFGGGVYTLPYTSYAGNKLNTINYMPRLGKIIITRFTADNSKSVNLSTVLQYRYVIIPGGVTAKTKAMVDLNDYQSVKQYYNLPN